MFDPDRRHLIAYVAAAAVLVVMAMRLVGGDRGSAQPAVSMAAPARPSMSSRPAAARPEPGGSILVDVAGAVRRPGLYALPRDARIATALRRAGGVSPRADRAAVNLAAKLIDGQQVFVPSRAGGARAAGAGGAAAGGAVAGTGGAVASTAAGGAGAGAPISLSNAPAAQLEELDGIGPALAARIIEYREQNGGFRSIDQLREVSGIGDKRLAALKDSVAP